MKLILRADDLGFSDGINCGILKSVKEGLISCVGMMPNMDESKNGYDMIKEYCDCIGQHTNICVGKPLTNPRLIPSLVQPNGTFCTSKEIRNRKDDTIVIEEAKLEIEAQLLRFKEITGRMPDYFEGHAVFSENFFTALKSIANKYGLFYCNPLEKEFIDKYGIQCAAFYKLDNKGLYDIDKYIFDDEAELKNKECSILIFHPGYLDQYILENSSYTLIRPKETEFLCSDRLKKYLEKEKIEVINFNLYNGRNKNGK